MHIRTISRQWVFAVMVLGMTLMSLVYSYPGGFKETIELSQQAVLLITGK